MNINNPYMLLAALFSINSTGLGSMGQTSNISGGSSELIFRNLLQNIQQNESGSTKQSVTAGTSMDSIFEEASKQYGVDVNLLKAIGKAESDFNASSKSSAGAMGVMQLMPETAKSLGVTNPYDARQNIMGGAKYIAGLLKQYGGNETLALAAYNAGSGNVAKYGGVPPFRETQNYIKRVLEYAGEPISSGKTVTGSVTQSAANTSSTTGESTRSETELLLSLSALMRTQMEMRLGSLLTQSSTGSNNSFEI